MLIHAHLQIVNNIQMKFHKLWRNGIWETGWSRSGPKKE
jgi:hypothetical protein